MDKNLKLGEALIDSLGSESAIAIASDVIELGIDAVLDDGLIRDIPVVGTLVSLSKIGVKIADRIFVSKLIKFLGGLKDIPSQECRDMASKLETDPSFERKVGEYLIEILDRSEAHRKPKMIAKVFAAYVSGEIDAIVLQRLNHAIELLPSY